MRAKVISGASAVASTIPFGDLTRGALFFIVDIHPVRCKKVFDDPYMKTDHIPTVSRELNHKNNNCLRLSTGLHGYIRSDQQVVVPKGITFELTLPDGWR